MKITILILSVISTMLLIGAFSYGLMALSGKATLQNHLEIAMLAVGSSMMTHILGIIHLLRRKTTNKTLKTQNILSEISF